MWYFDYIGDGGREKDSGTQEDKECTTDREKADKRKGDTIELATRMTILTEGRSTSSKSVTRF